MSEIYFIIILATTVLTSLAVCSATMMWHINNTNKFIDKFFDEEEEFIKKQLFELYFELYKDVSKIKGRKNDTV